MFKSMTVPDPTTGNPMCFSVPIVQELALHDPHTLPEKYLAPEQDRPSLSLSIPCKDDLIPVIDMSILHDNPKELEKLASAAQEWGFFQVINHGIPGSLMGRMRSVAKGFFQLPLEEKLKYEMKNNQGYGQAFVTSEEQRLDWADIMYLYTLPVESRDLNQWPKTANFRETMYEYAFETQILAKKLLNVLAQGVGINPDCFVESFGEFCGSVRINHYPPCPRPDLVLGLSPHSDGTGITILLQDDECSWEALQIHKGEEWIPVPSIPDALVINIGDLLEHILYAHGSWFAKEYGSLSIWNTQGMEKSHKLARTVYHRSTQHGGGSVPSNPLIQMSHWFYRRMLYRLNQKKKLTSMNSIDAAVREVNARQKRRRRE